MIKCAKILVISVSPGYPQGAPLQVNCVGVPLVGTQGLKN
jgi:hypothetical protein